MDTGLSPIIMLELNKIYNENCLDTLARMESDSIDCVVTSPPYYALRRYEIPDSIWGGAKDCPHVWGELIKVGQTTAPTKYKSAESGFTQKEDSFCVKCKAWRGQLGLEPDFRCFIDHLILIFAEVKRVLKPSGTVWVNLGDSYSTTPSGKCSEPFKTSGITKSENQKVARQVKESGRLDSVVKNKSLMNIPSRFAIRMTDELGFIQRNQINWHKPACMPSSAKDRFTVDFEPIFFFTKSKKYYFEQQFDTAKRAGQFNNRTASSSEYAISRIIQVKEQRNKRTTWKVPYEPQSKNHYASYPTKLIEIPIKAGCPVGGVVYDPFAGTGTTLLVAHRLGRKFIGSDLGTEYAGIMEERLMPELAQAKLF